MRKNILLLAILIGVASGLWHVSRVEAARGIPGNGEFGYGARLNLNSPYFEDALDLAIDLPVDWLAVTVRWDEFASPHSSRWQELDRLMSRAESSGVAVLVSVTAAPASAITATGPNAEQAAQFILTLAQRYDNALSAVELFPGANTAAGWGCQPDPAAYSGLYATIQKRLHETYPHIILAAAGLQPNSGRNIADMSDLDFLSGLYSANPALALPVISIQLTGLAPDPLAPSSEAMESPTLRHYEEVRALMLQHNHQNDLIWVTSFGIPSGTINMPDRSSQGVDAQKQFFVQALTQMRSQLYIGITVYNCLNPASGLTDQAACLVTDPNEYHPLVTVFRKLIAQNSPSIVLTRNGKPKTEAIIKNRH